jgi:hypothetical protein
VFADSSDKEKLVDAVLGVWAKTLQTSYEDDAVKEARDRVLDNMAEVFPESVFHDLPKMLVTAMTSKFGKDSDSRRISGTLSRMLPPVKLHNPWQRKSSQDRSQRCSTSERTMLASDREENSQHQHVETALVV